MDIDIDSIRKRDQWARAVGTRAYSDVARKDYAGTSYQFNTASAQDALADRNWLLSEVDRLSAENGEMRAALERAAGSLGMRVVTNLMAKVEEAQAAVWENFWGMVCGACNREEVYRAEVEKLRAELEALRADNIDTGMVFIGVAQERNMLRLELNEAHAAIWGLLCALGNHEDELQQLDAEANKDVAILRALVEQCRPVVEAVRKWREATHPGDKQFLYEQLRFNLSLPTMPEVKP